MPYTVLHHGVIYLCVFNIERNYYLICCVIFQVALFSAATSILFHNLRYCLPLGPQYVVVTLCNVCVHVVPHLCRVKVIQSVCSSGEESLVQFHVISWVSYSTHFPHKYQQYHICITIYNLNI